MTATDAPALQLNAAPSGISYKVLTAWRGPPANRGQLVAELADATARKLHFDLYGPATAQVEMNGRSPQVAGIQELSQDLVVHRWNPVLARYECFFRGPIGHTADTLDASSHKVNIQAADYRALLTSRTILRTARTYSATDQAGIFQDIINTYTQGQPDPYDLGLWWVGPVDPTGQPIASTGVVRDRSYTATEVVGTVLDNLGACINGFDWSADPVDPYGAQISGAARCANVRLWYPRRGTTVPFVAEYGATVARLTRTVDSTGFANGVTNTGSGTPPMVANSYGDVFTNPQLHAEGMWPETISNPTVVVQATLQQQADGRLALDSILIPSYSLVLMPNVWFRQYDCWLGDTIEIRIASGRLNVDTQARIITVDIDIDNDGNEQVTLTVARVTPTLASVLGNYTTQLQALSRR
jgi:hypothetical protein